MRTCGPLSRAATMVLSQAEAAASLQPRRALLRAASTPTRSLLTLGPARAARPLRGRSRRSEPNEAHPEASIARGPVDVRSSMPCSRGRLPALMLARSRRALRAQRRGAPGPARCNLAPPSPHAVAAHARAHLVRALRAKANASTKRCGGTAGPSSSSSSSRERSASMSCCTQCKQRGWLHVKHALKLPPKAGVGHHVDGAVAVAAPVPSRAAPNEKGLKVDKGGGAVARARVHHLAKDDARVLERVPVELAAARLLDDPLVARRALALQRLHGLVDRRRPRRRAGRGRDSPPSCAASPLPAAAGRRRGRGRGRDAAAAAAAAGARLRRARGSSSCGRRPPRRAPWSNPRRARLRHRRRRRHASATAAAASTTSSALDAKSAGEKQRESASLTLVLHWHGEDLHTGPNCASPQTTPSARDARGTRSTMLSMALAGGADGTWRAPAYVPVRSQRSTLQTMRAKAIWRSPRVEVRIGSTRGPRSPSPAR